MAAGRHLCLQRRPAAVRGRDRGGRAEHRGCIQLGGEWRERDEEDGGGRTCRQLLQVSRLLRNRPAYQERFGADAYEAMLGNCLWGVYQMIGKLNPRVYLLHRCPAGLGCRAPHATTTPGKPTPWGPEPDNMRAAILPDSATIGRAESAIGAVKRPARTVTFRNELSVRCLEGHDRRLTATMTPLLKPSSAQTSSALPRRR